MKNNLFDQFFLCRCKYCKYCYVFQFIKENWIYALNVYVMDVQDYVYIFC